MSRMQLAHTSPRTRMGWYRALRHVGLRLPAALGLALSVCLFTLLNLPAANADATQSAYPGADAACSALAADHTATNGPGWGRTILAGHNAPGGWFGVDVCSNGTNSPLVAGSSVSCDRLPLNWTSTGCAPGMPTADGFGWTFQCPELVVRFSAWAFGDSPAAWGRASGGNAPDLWLPGNYPSDFVAYPNGSTHAPVPGDILVWGSLDRSGAPWPAGPSGAHDGHIAVVAEVHNGIVVTAEQNVKWGDSDHPSDTLALTRVGSGWILSGSTAHGTTLPTYRWQRTMGLSRGTYGWLHSLRNTGTFPSSSHAVAPATKPTPAATSPAPTATRAPTPTLSPTATPTAAPSPTSSHGSPAAQVPVELPSLAPAVVITGGGTLADLVWTDPGSSPSAQGTPVASVRALASPAATPLATGQDPPVVTLASGARYVFVVGQDGRLYQARTDPSLSGVAWSDLGAPDNVVLAPSPAATMYAGGMAVLARGVDGSMWWRAGAPGNLGSWMPVGTSADLRFAPSLVLTGAPGSGNPLLVGLGADGLLYEREWQSASSAQDGPDTQPGWSTARPVSALPKGVRLGGHLAWVTEPALSQSRIGDWSDAPLDIFALDTTGALWRLRCTDIAARWTETRIADGEGALRRLLSAAVVVTPANDSGATAATSENVYISETSAVYRYAMPLLPTASSQPQPRTPDRLPALPPTPSASTGVALPLSDGNSALVVPGKSGIQVLGTADALSFLGAAAAPAASAPAGGQPSPMSPANAPQAGAQPTGAVVALGAVPQAGLFSDPLKAPEADARWVPADTNQRVVTAADGTRLDSSDAGAGALLQTAPSSDVTVAVHAAVDGKSGDDAAGLRFSMGDAGSAALQVGGDGRVRLCLAHGMDVPQCSAPAAPPAAGGGIWLKLTVHAGTVTGWASQDSTSWVQVDSRRFDATRAARADESTLQSSPTPATPAPPALVQPGETLLRYTEVGLFVAGKSKTSAVFHDFAVMPGGTGGSAATPSPSERTYLRSSLR